MADLTGRMLDVNICILSFPLLLKLECTVVLFIGLYVRHLFSQLIYRIGIWTFRD
ncbi:hypothetical protein ACSAZK_01110 [Methanosarcina sp. Mfa9]|uniref:hypothetical protein n=1 Tax=Methanosarcina sp. Mfa9 TaxID=3439063 RepID=UPI003F84CA56